MVKEPTIDGLQHCVGCSWDDADDDAAGSAHCCFLLHLPHYDAEEYIRVIGPIDLSTPKVLSPATTAVQSSSTISSAFSSFRLA